MQPRCQQYRGAYPNVEQAAARIDCAAELRGAGRPLLAHRRHPLRVACIREVWPLPKRRADGYAEDRLEIPYDERAAVVGR